jgi:WD40 repeat protein
MTDRYLHSTPTRRSLRRPTLFPSSLSPKAGTLSGANALPPAPSVLRTPPRRPHTPTTGGRSSYASASHGDRFIPNQQNMNHSISRRAMASTPKRHRRCDPKSPKEILQQQFDRHLLSVMCNIPIEKINDENDDIQPSSLLGIVGSCCEPFAKKSRHTVDPFALDTLREGKLLGSRNNNGPAARQDIAVLSPHTSFDAVDVSPHSFSNPMDWSADNVLAVAMAFKEVWVLRPGGDFEYAMTFAAPCVYISSVQWCHTPGMTHLLALGGDDGTVRVLDMSEGGVTAAERRAPEIGRVSSLAWAQSWLTMGSLSGLIVSFDIRSRDVVASYNSPQPIQNREIFCLRWSSDDKSLASASVGHGIYIWDPCMTRTHSVYSVPRRILSGHTNSINAVDWSPHRRGILASGGNDETVRLWDVISSSSTPAVSCTQMASSVNALVWSRSNDLLFTAHGDYEYSIAAYDSASMEKRMENADCHKGALISIALDPQHMDLASISVDGRLSLWKVGAERRKKYTGDLFGIGMPQLNTTPIR